MPSIQVQESDLEVLCSISKTSIVHAVDAPSNVLKDIVAHSRKNIELCIASAECVFLKFVDGEKILGYILIKDYWNLSDLFILPEHQNQGIGKALLKDATDRCKLYSNKRYIRLNSSLNAEEFYRRFGFKVTTNGPSKSAYSVPMEYTY